MESWKIGNIGERHVVAWLAANGYRCNHDTQHPGSTDIEARGPTASLLVQVKASIHPTQPAFLSPSERANIIARANRLGWQAWAARLFINQQGQLVGQIAWEKLN